MNDKPKTGHESVQDEREVDLLISSFLGTAVSTFLLGIVSQALLRTDFLLGVIGGCVLGFILGIGFTAQKYGPPENVPAWIIRRAKTGW